MGCAASCNNVTEVEDSVIHVSFGLPQLDMFHQPPQKVENFLLPGKLVTRRDGKPALPKHVWIKRMSLFISTHILQIKTYNIHQFHEMQAKLASFESGDCCFNYNLDNPQHANAIKEIRTILIDIDTFDDMCIYFLAMCHKYCDSDRVEDFEHIAFIFSIVVNSPMIKAYETKW